MYRVLRTNGGTESNVSPFRTPNVARVSDMAWRSTVDTDVALAFCFVNG